MKITDPKEINNLVRRGDIASFVDDASFDAFYEWKDKYPDIKIKQIEIKPFILGDLTNTDIVPEAWNLVTIIYSVPEKIENWESPNDFIENKHLW